MRRVRTTYDQAAKDYKEYYGECPTVNRLNELYHKYANEWKHFDNFADWLTNYTP